MIQPSHSPGGSPRRSAPRPQPRICLITSEQLSTNPRIVKEADALSGAGYDVRVVSCQWMNWPRQEDKKLVASRPWRSQIIDYTREYSPGLFWFSRIRHHLARRFFAPLFATEKMKVRAIGRVIPEMVEVATSEPADLFIGHNLAGLPAAVLAAQKRGAQAAFDAEDLHSAMWHYQTGPLSVDRLAEDTERRFLPHCRYVTAAAPLIAEGYATRYGIQLPETILNMFPLADRPQEFRPPDPGAPLKLYWFSQTIGARRGLEDIIRAIGLCGSPNVELHLRGEWQAGYEEKLSAFAKEAGLRESQMTWHRVASPGDMIRLSAEYDVGLALEQPVSENRDICLTNKIFTYLLAGNAIVATATRGQKQLMREIPGAGLCYEIGDIETLAAQLRDWERDRDSLERARRCAWKYGEENYNWDRQQTKLIAIVQRALANDCVTA